MARIPLTGGAYQARSVIASAQRSLNLYPEPMPQTQGEPAQFAHYPTPGLTLLGTLPQGPVRGIRQATGGNIYAVAGSGAYLVNPTTWIGTLLGSITTLRPYPVGMADNGNTLVIVDGSNGGWTVDLPSNSFGTITDTAFYGADRVDFMDTYLIFNKPGTPQFYSSNSLAVTPFNSLWFADIETISQLLVTIICSRREIWLLGTKGTEVWYDTGAPDFPFGQIPGIYLEHGCAAKYSIAQFDNAIFWLASTPAGERYVMTGFAGGYMAKRVSTFAIEGAMRTYATISDAIGFVYALGGHVCYVLTFPSADHTWVYDITTTQWHEWAWIDNNGREHRSRANCAYNCNGIVVVGDWENGNLYQLDIDAYTDNGQPIKRQRAFPHIITELTRVYYRHFTADIETGEALPVQVITSVQQIITWPPQIAAYIGLGGTTNTLVAMDWQRGVAYFVDQTIYSKYALTLTTQTAPLASLTIPSQVPQATAVDPISGDLLAQRGTTNGEPVLKLDPTTFATLATFGTATSTPSYPGSVWIAQAIVCVVCNNVSYAILKESAYSGGVAVFRVDTMQQAGFYQALVSGSTNNRGIMCAGASGGNTATAFLTWQDLTYTASVPLYEVTIRAGAEAYNPSSWPTTNPFITSLTVGTITASSVDPAWSHIAAHSIGYDLADGNIIMHVGTSDAVTNVAYIIKVNSATAAVMWVVPVTAKVNVNLQQSRINGSLWVFESVLSGPPGTSWQINTLTGQSNSQPLGGVSYNIPGFPISDSQNQVALYWQNYTSGPSSPVGVPGTGTFTNGWALMGGMTAVGAATTSLALTDNDISLDWSNDRGHSFGNPVAQNIGNRGAYITSLQWQRLGYARDRVFRLTWSVPMRTALQGAFVDADSSPKT